VPGWGDWFPRADSTYIRMYGSSLPPKALSAYPSDWVLYNEILRQLLPMNRAIEINSKGIVQKSAIGASSLGYTAY
jgi:hypothetical protein